MASIEIKVSCGCGFLATDPDCRKVLAAAAAHADSTGHTLNGLVGTIQRVQVSKEVADGSLVGGGKGEAKEERGYR